MRRARVAATAMLMAAGLERALSACAVCFLMEPNATTDGVHAAVLTMVAITSVVLACFAAFMARVARRSRPAHPPHPSNPSHPTTP
jgi:heme/copper-type cytochrome/quinol oxidase subunit 2